MKNDHKQFKPYDRVLVRDGANIWQIDFYSHWNKEKEQHITLAYGDGIVMTDRDILPFEGNEHLLGTKDDPEAEVKLEKGEWIVGFDEDEMYYPPFFIGRYGGLHNKMFIIDKSCERELAIRFSDFNPEDMDETRKHILCVRNGKIVKFKERD